jgi:hypothetical protein
LTLDLTETSARAWGVAFLAPVSAAYLVGAFLLLRRRRGAPWHQAYLLGLGGLLFGMLVVGSVGFTFLAPAAQDSLIEMIAGMMATVAVSGTLVAMWKALPLGPTPMDAHVSGPARRGPTFERFETSERADRERR